MSRTRLVALVHVIACLAGAPALVLAAEWKLATVPASGDASLRPVAKQPASAVYTESGFRQSSTPLAANAETMPGRRMSAKESLATMTTPDDLAVELVLQEPAVAQPTHISFDERGRMWVAQYRQYPYPAGVKMISRDKYYRGRYDKVPPPPPGHDRGADVVSVHEDTDGDGKFDKDKVVLDGLNMATASLRGHGGFWVMNSPYLMFYPDADGDDVPDRDPEVRLAGFGLEDTHSAPAGLVWGPDGWIYGVQGSGTNSRIVRPGIDPPGAPGVYHEGCMLSGFLVENDAAVVVMRGTDGQDLRVPRERIDRMKRTGASLMPEGLLDGLDDQQVRDFFAYLRIPQPITR